MLSLVYCQTNCSCPKPCNRFWPLELFPSYSLWNLQTMRPSRASFGRSGWSRVSQSPAVCRRRCLPSASSSLMKTRTWSLKSTPIWQWTPVPVGKCFGLFHQPPSHKLIPNFCTGRKTEDVHFITLEELSTALRIVKSKVLFQKEFLPVSRRLHASVEIWTYEETLCLCLTRMFSCFYNLSSYAYRGHTFAVIHHVSVQFV